MSRAVWKEALDLSWQNLSRLGYRKHPGDKVGWDFSCEINSETLGLIGLSKVDRSGRRSLTQISPEIGVRNQRLESLLEEITTKLSYHWQFTGFNATLRVTLGSLVPDKQDWGW